MNRLPRSPHSAFQCEVAQFSAVFAASGVPLLRHPGLDPGSIAATALWTPDQVRGDDGLKRSEKTPIACEVTQFSGLFA